MVSTTIFYYYDIYFYDKSNKRIDIFYLLMSFLKIIKTFIIKVFIVNFLEEIKKLEQYPVIKNRVPGPSPGNKKGPGRPGTG